MIASIWAGLSVLVCFKNTTASFHCFPTIFHTLLPFSLWWRWRASFLYSSMCMCVCVCVWQGNESETPYDRQCPVLALISKTNAILRHRASFEIATPKRVVSCLLIGYIHVIIPGLLIAIELRLTECPHAFGNHHHSCGCVSFAAAWWEFCFKWGLVTFLHWCCPSSSCRKV